MEVQSDYIEKATSALVYQNFSFCKTEDSGYHTSFTPGSLECSELSSDFLDQSLIGRTTYVDQIQLECRITPEVNIRPSRKYSQLKRNDTWTETPPVRRAVKRPHPSVEPASPRNSAPTPTTFIAGKIQSLDVNERNKENAAVTSDKSYCTQSAKRYMCKFNAFDQTAPYPVTPIKRNCKSSPCKRSAKKLDFAIHSLPCVKNELLPVPKHSRSTSVSPILTRPDQKIDILCWLYESRAIPPLERIFSYLSVQDISNFCMVSPKWEKLWKENNTDEKKYQLKKYIKGVIANQENDIYAIKPRTKITPYDGCLKEIQNEMNDAPVNQNHSSPPQSPRTNRFRKFVKSASLDSRIQLPCVRCSQPAKVTEETTGEKWVECTNATCSFQFCRYCNSTRHPGRSCVQYDLNAPSPSKRKKCVNVIGTRKSRKNLRRLL